jgi:hypothetical protein
MEISSIRLSNNFSATLKISLEPEGTIFELPAGEFVELILLEELRQAIDFQINKDSGELCISLWPEKGNYKLLYKGEEV